MSSNSSTLKSALCWWVIRRCLAQATMAPRDLQQTPHTVYTHSHSPTHPHATHSHPLSYTPTYHNLSPAQVHTTAHMETHTGHSRTALHSPFQPAVDPLLQGAKDMVPLLLALPADLGKPEWQVEGEGQGGEGEGQRRGTSSQSVVFPHTHWMALTIFVLNSLSMRWMCWLTTAIVCRNWRGGVSFWSPPGIAGGGGSSRLEYQLTRRKEGTVY